MIIPIEFVEILVYLYCKLRKPKKQPRAKLEINIQQSRNVCRELLAKSEIKKNRYYGIICVIVAIKFVPVPVVSLIPLH